jgi:hypothetical protein
MVRVSSVLLPTNAAGVPKQEITNSSIAITAASTLAVEDSTAQSSLSNIETSLSGTLDVSDSTAQGSLTDIVTAVQGTLSVSSSVTINGSRTNLANAASTSAGGNSTAVDVSAYSKNTVYINASTNDEIEIWWSPDGTNWYYRQSVMGDLPSAGGSSYYASASFDNEVIHSIRLTYTATAALTAGVMSRV